jgi:orotidine-5'-phosphate decarboxylase
MTELIVALDVDDLATARTLTAAGGNSVGWYKIGSHLFTRCGPAAVRMLKDAGKNVFLDLKFHDIPNTVAGAVAAAAELGVDMVNVHASGGSAMMKAARKALDPIPPERRPLLIAVTVLTSMDQAALGEVLGVATPPADQVRRLARMARDSGMDGVVASAHEIALIREACGPEFQLVIPGIRPRGSDHGDQQRVMTPGEAARHGANFIVVGRPVLQAPDPAAAAAAIVAEMADAPSAHG